MATPTIQVRLTLHRAVFAGSEGKDFEDILRGIDQAAMDCNGLISERATNKKAAINRITSHPSNTGIGAAVSLYETGAVMSTLRIDGGRRNIDIGEISPPNGEEFLDSCVYLYAVGNDVVCANIGGRDRLIMGAISKIAIEHKVIAPNTLVQLMQRPSRNTLDLINKFGVKSIRFDATPLLGGADDFARGNLKERIFGGGSPSKSMQRRRENTAWIEIRANGRISKNLDLFKNNGSDDWLSEVAKDAYENGNINRFIIELNNKDKIRSDEITVSRTVALKRNNSTFDLDSAHEEMLKFYNDLSQGSGAL